MRSEQAEAALVPLVVATSGWTDDAVDLFVRELSTLAEADVLAMVCLELARTWRSDRRPGMGDVFSAYRTEIRRRELAAPPLSIAERVVGLPEGRRIAAEAYASECKLQQREPNWTLFNKTLGTVG